MSASLISDILAFLKLLILVLSSSSDVCVFLLYFELSFACLASDLST